MVGHSESGVNKGRGMRILSRHFDIPTAQMMAFGDYDNDIPMLETVGYSYIMANATRGWRSTRSIGRAVTMSSGSCM